MNQNTASALTKSTAKVDPTTTMQMQMRGGAGPWLGADPDGAAIRYQIMVSQSAVRQKEMKKKLLKRKRSDASPARPLPIGNRHKQPTNRIAA
jgi:hypothetical protein